jgi:hypothetical protein
MRVLQPSVRFPTTPVHFDVTFHKQSNLPLSLCSFQAFLNDCAERLCGKSADLQGSLFDPAYASLRVLSREVE